MLIDNTSTCPFELGRIFTDGYVRVIWRARKGRSEWIREQYIKDMGGYVFYNRTRREATIPVKTWWHSWWDDVNFIAEWELSGRSAYVLKDKTSYTIRSEPFDEHLI